MRRKYLRELAAAELPERGDDSIVTEAEIAALPKAVQRYLGFMNVVGKPRVWSFRCQMNGRFRPALDKPWYACETFQHNTRTPIERRFFISIRFGGLVPTLARDTYVGGHGRMLVRALDLVTLVDATGRELDIGELTTWLNDAVLLAPSMLLAPNVRFTELDDASFEVALTDRGTTVSARVLLDERGAPVNFTSTDRFVGSGKSWIRREWTTPVLAFTEIDGRRVMSSAQAVWMLPSGPSPYADFTVRSLELNVPATREQFAAA